MPIDEVRLISEVTRRAIFDHLQVARISWSGRMEEADFLQRIYDLRQIPSTDNRPAFRANAALDIWQHRVNNSDWDDYWVFTDSRFNLLWGSDELFLRFLAEMIHPVVRPDQADVDRVAGLVNAELRRDGFELVATSHISGRPVFSARRVEEHAEGEVFAAREIGAQLSSEYVSAQISRMELGVQSDASLAIGTAKEFVETIAKLVLER